MWPRRCRRGRPHLGAISRALLEASMWPRRCRRGRPGFCCARSKSGTASMRPRRCRRGRLEMLRRVCSAAVASMWPRRCRRGRRSGGSPGRRPPKGFNVATTMSSWKTESFCPVWGLVSKLQCGHDDVVVEDEKLRIGALEHSHASMWPRRCRRGRLSFLSLQLKEFQMLQCGHDDVVVEDATTRPS